MPGDAAGRTIPQTPHTCHADPPSSVFQSADMLPRLPREVHVHHALDTRARRFPTPATQNADLPSSAAHALPRLPTPATRNARMHTRGGTRDML